jgi:polyisoprenyl-phosphate glycosyltransferase
MDISVIIPVYNGEKTIEDLYRKLGKALCHYSNWEIIFIYDCGNDNSWQVISGITKKHPEKVRSFRLSRNYGQHNAILFGIKEALGDLMITLDEDLQHDPSIIWEMIEKLKEGNYDLVYARFNKLKHPGMRIWASELLRGILKNIVPGLFPGYSPFRLIKREIATKITLLRNSYTFLDGYLGMVTDNIGYINAEHFRRADGVSSYTYYKLFRHAVMIAIAYSPLKRWILTLALLFNSFSIFLFLGPGITGHSNSVKFMFFLTGITGIILLFCGLLAEAIHFKGMRTNRMPVVD